MRSASGRQKARLAALQQELGEANARLAAFNPRQTERLLMEVGRLRETVATLSTHKVATPPAHSRPPPSHMNPWNATALASESFRIDDNLQEQSL